MNLKLFLSLTTMIALMVVIASLTLWLPQAQAAVCLTNHGFSLLRIP